MTRVYCRSPSQMNAFRQSGSSSRATVKRILAGAIHGGADKKVAWAFLTRGTKVGWGRQIDFSSSKNIVFLRYGAEQECSGYLFVLGVRNARATFLYWASPQSGRISTDCAGNRVRLPAAGGKWLPPCRHRGTVASGLPRAGRFCDQRSCSLRTVAFQNGMIATGYVPSVLPGPDCCEKSTGPAICRAACPAGIAPVRRRNVRAA